MYTTNHAYVFLLKIQTTNYLTPFIGGNKFSGLVLNRHCKMLNFLAVWYSITMIMYIHP